MNKQQLHKNGGFIQYNTTASNCYYYLIIIIFTILVVTPNNNTQAALMVVSVVMDWAAQSIDQFDTLFSTLLNSFSNTVTNSFLLYAAGTFLAIAAPAWVFLHYRKIAGDSKFAYSQRIEGEVFITDDEYFTADEAEYTEYAEYDEKMPFHEALFASIFSSTTVTNTASSIETPIFTTEPASLKNKVENSPRVFCEICLENKESWQMFRNDKCSHSFCCECTTNHIIAKIQDRVKRVACPAPNCKARLNNDTCRLMIPEYALVQWDEMLCLSLIQESSKLYCPFQDCSAMLIKDSGVVFREVQCVSCKRSFCAECHVPWHMEFTCKEFQKWYAKKGGKDDKIVKKLAKKKNWQKCPKCKMYVEKAEGCVHMTCRCKYQFCYRCGSKWSDSHGGNCKQR